MVAHQWEPPELCTCCASPARIKDCFLNGGQAWEIEKSWCANAARIMPSLPRVYSEEREFVRRAIRFAVQERDIHRFLTIGGGLPDTEPMDDYVLPFTSGQVVYADKDRYVLAYLDLLASEHDQIDCVRGDFHVPGTILFTDVIEDLLSDGTPICLVLNGVLDATDDTEALAATLGCYTERLPPGSLMIATHATVDGLDTDNTADLALVGQMRQVCQLFRTPHWPQRHLRTAEELGHLLRGLDLLEPGITFTANWANPRRAGDRRPAESLCLAAVAAVPSLRTAYASVAGVRASGRCAR
ncbi:S-adenosyl methyltransferase [Amycolatopsis tolypomycina]|uniref:S-adenosyl methyltransferase n=1 Tax=Amycolatopsis tolypomycina TaxID=208445 RepID=A0A1H4JM70_9PSEU|nr:S-adenosyl methyltransferase [Amycolatopsis tolypomycina]